MSAKLTESEAKAIAAYLADWWAERLRRGDRAIFRAHLSAAVETHLLACPAGRLHLSLECDYDPQGPLLDAVRAAGVECRGFLFSAQGILPQKCSTVVFPARLADHEYDQEAAPARLVIKEGYGRWNDPIPLADVIEAGRAVLQKGNDSTEGFSRKREGSVDG